MKAQHAETSAGSTKTVTVQISRVKGQAKSKELITVNCDGSLTLEQGKIQYASLLG